MKKSVTFRFDENTLALLEKVKVEYEKTTKMKFNKTDFIENALNIHLVNLCDILGISNDQLPFN